MAQKLELEFKIMVSISNVSPPALATNKSILVGKDYAIHHFLQAFRVDFNHVVFELIARKKIEGSQS